MPSLHEQISYMKEQASATKSKSSHSGTHLQPSRLGSSASWRRPGILTSRTQTSSEGDFQALCSSPWKQEIQASHLKHVEATRASLHRTEVTQSPSQKLAKLEQKTAELDGSLRLRSLKATKCEAEPPNKATGQ